ncbi:hypothetical protein CEXT_601121 [Caerostris extrusa]|uniref:Uncharacterized protein n=1 Tax=Caerostris extrusa TaxID=172846 RepID=A0AAV4Y940_CAEEX|nr:hypothetical protein CEXT_601121 [Caerostris extrusa]
MDTAAVSRIARKENPLRHEAMQQDGDGELVQGAGGRVRRGGRPGAGLLRGLRLPTGGAASGPSDVSGPLLRGGTRHTVALGVTVIVRIGVD